MADIDANVVYIDEFGDYVRASVHPAIGRAAQQAELFGCEKSGFTGLLFPLQRGMDVLAGLAELAGKLMVDKMAGTYQGLYATAREYARVEENNVRNLTSSGSH